MPNVTIEVRKRYTREEEEAVLNADRTIRLDVHEPHRFATPPGKDERYTLVDVDLFRGRSLAAKKVLLRDSAAQTGGIRGGVPASEVDLGFKVDVQLLAGYSGTPLSKKLGLKPPMTLVLIDAPKDYRSLLGEVPKGITIASHAPQRPRAVHVFATKKAVLEAHLATQRKRLEQSGFVWVSWPKKASKVETDITEDTIRDIALPLGFVDIKVCAVSDVWSGLKLVIRKNERC